MKILIISQYFPPDVTAAAYRIGETARLLKRAGDSIRVITSTPHKGGIDLSNADGFTDDEVLRVKVDELGKGGVISYLTQYLGFAWGALRLAVAAHRKEKFDVVWVTSPPLFVVLCSLGLKWIFRVPTVFDVRDIWPESAVAIGKVRRGSLMERCGKLLERVAYRHCNSLTCVSKPMRAYIAERTSRPVAVVYNGVLESMAMSTPVPASQPDTIGYAGNLGHAQNLETLLKAFAKARRSAPDKNHRLRLIGTGALTNELQGLAAELGIADVVDFMGPRPKAEAMELTSECGTLLIPLADSPAFDLTIPSKVFDYMALGRPIIATVRGEAASILKASGGNIVVEPGNELELTRAIIHVWQELPRLAASAERNRRIVLEKYTREAATEVLRNTLLVSAGHPPLEPTDADVEALEA